MISLDPAILLNLGILLLSAKIFGEIAERFRVSSMVGEIVGGIIVGPLLGFITPSSGLQEFADFGIIMLMFLIGLSTKFEDAKQEIYAGSALALVGMGLSFIVGVAVGYFLLENLLIGIILGASIISTSTAITMRSLMDLGEFKDRVGRLSLSIDIADEVVAILTLTLLSTWVAIGSVEIWKVFGLFFAVIGFFVIILTAASKFFSKFLSALHRIKDEQIMLAAPLVLVFFVAFFSEHVSIAAITGAFLAGMAMSQTPFTESIIIPKVKVLAFGFFVPIFFAYSAVILDISVFLNPALLTVLAVLVIGGILAKLIGCGLFSRLFSVNDREQRLIGAGMIPRGEYSIIIAQFALAAAIITQQIYTVVIAFVMVSILVTPIFLRAFKHSRTHIPRRSRFSLRRRI